MSLKITDLPQIPSGIIGQHISIPVSKSETDPKTYKMNLAQTVAWLQTQGIGGGGGYSGFSGATGATGPTGATGAAGPATPNISISFNPVKVFYYKNDNTTTYGVTATAITANTQSLTATSSNPVHFALIRYNAAGAIINTTLSAGTGLNYNTIPYTTTDFGTATSVTVSAAFTTGGITYTAIDQIVRVVDGADGQPTLAGILSNYTAVLPAGTDGTVTDYTNATGVFNVYLGQTLIPAGDITYSVIGQTNVVGSISNLGIYNVSSITSGSTSGNLKLQATYGTKSVSAVFTLTKAKQGTAGTAKILRLDLNKSVFVFTGGIPVTTNDTVSATVTLDNIIPYDAYTTVQYTATLFDASNTPTSITLLNTSNSAIKVIPITAFTSNPTAVTCVVNASIRDADGAYYTATQTVVRLDSGTSTLNGNLTNDNTTINANSDGTTSSSVSALSGDFKVYLGAVDVSNSCTFGVYNTINGGGSTITFVASANDGSVKNRYVVTNIGATLNATFVLSAIYTGKVIYKTFTVSKIVAAPQGDTGAGPVYQGTYSNTSRYYYIPGVRTDIVLYNGNYYMASSVALNGNTGWPTPGSNPAWASFGATFSSVATDLLLTKDAVIGRFLNMGGNTYGSIPQTAIRSYSVAFDGSPIALSATIAGGNVQIGETVSGAGNGFYLGYPQNATNGANAIFYVGNGLVTNSSNYLLWDGNNLNINGSVNITPLRGGGIRSGKTSYLDTTSGFWLGTGNDGYPKFNIGDSSSSLKWDSSAGSLVVNGTINVTGGNAATQAYASGVATTAADLASNTAYLNAKAIADSVAAGTYSGGSFISGTTVYAPIVAGAGGYFSELFKVGNNGITMDGTAKAIYIGGGHYNNTDTGFYVDSTGQFSLKDKLKWDGSNLTVVGTIKVSDGTEITSTTIGKANSSLQNNDTGKNLGLSGGTVGGVTISSNSLTLGTGTYGNSNTAFYVGSSGFSLGSNLTFDGSTLTVNGTVKATSGYIGGTSSGWAIGSGQIQNSTGGRTTTLNSDATITLANPSGYGTITLDSNTSEGSITIGGVYTVSIAGGNVNSYLKINGHSLTYNSGWLFGGGSDSVTCGQLTVGGNGIQNNGGMQSVGTIGIGPSGNPGLILLAADTGIVTAAGFNSTSSRKWKENITPITNALDTVSKLQGVTFDWNNKDLKNDFGLIAEDVNEVLPTIVGKDIDNNISGVDYGRITALLIETVKELNTRIKALENR